MRRVSQQEWENEHMNNPMTEGEALAVDESLLWWLNDAANVMAEMGNDSHVPKLRQIHEALTAHTAASGGEVACHRWWRNGELVDSDWTNGPPSERQIEAQRQCRDIADWTVEYAYRAPPAAVPADALTVDDAMVERAHRAYGGACVLGAPNTKVAMKCALLAALIPKGADHEQR